ncbi:MAG: putative oxidoreductase, partial [Microbacteriaceae bacterium]|nr:putative oxidoreductase [Microbacteriaceae bacterium]
MDIGVLYWPSDRTVSVPDLARALEVRGFSGLWVSEHTHIPASRKTRWPVNPGSELPSSYLRMHDPLIALAAAATVTETLTLGTSICLLAQRDPIVTAKQVASIDHLSNGRVKFGVGYGWNLEEVRNHGIAPSDRRDVLRENVEVMRQLWTMDVAEYAGEHVTLAPSWQ